MVQGTIRALRASAAASVCALGLGACGSLLPQQTDHASGQFKNYAALKQAYDHVTPGRTRVNDLSGMGFDSSEPNVEELSYLGVMERFLPRANMGLNDLAPEVRNCVNLRQRCTAFVFRPSLEHSERTGDTMLDVFGFDRTTVSHGWSAEVTLLVEDDRVIYKVISGKPHIENEQEKVQPLGPLQDLGSAVVPAAEHL
jgi:hypothetical protein